MYIATRTLGVSGPIPDIHVIVLVKVVNCGSEFPGMVKGCQVHKVKLVCSPNYICLVR